MKYFSGTPLIIIITFLLLTTGTKADEKAIELHSSFPRQPLVQNISTVTPTATISPTQTITATLILGPFPGVTLAFPELPDSVTPISPHVTKEPIKGIPLSMISSNNSPTGKSKLVYAVVIFWLILVVFAVLIARKTYQHWISNNE